MLNFLNDTENLLIENRISSLIETQLPNFYQEEGPDFLNFIRTYYEWMELHELTVSDVTQFEFKFFDEDDNNFLTEDGDVLILESVRNDLSGFENGETIKGVESGATATVTRSTYITDDKIYIKDLTPIDFLPNEIIIGQTTRVQAAVNSFLKNPTFGSRSLLKNIDLNTSTSNFVDILFKQFLSDFQLNIKSDKAHVIKHIVDIYRSKGSNISFDFLFKTIYNEQNLVFHTPKEDIFKLSSGRWVNDRVLRITSDSPLIDFEGRTIFGRKSQSTALVDQIDRYAAGNLTVTELYLKNITGNFTIGEIVRTNVIDGNYAEGTTLGVLTDIIIDNPGTNYEIGDLLTISGGGGIEATARVKSVATGTLTDFLVLDGGDGYTSSSELTVNNFGTRGSGFAGKISEIQNAYTYHYNSDFIYKFVGIRLSAPAFGMSGDPTCDINCRLVDALGWTKLNSGPISAIKTLVVGTNYSAPPQITATDKITVTMDQDSGVKILNLNSDPDSSVFTPAITGNFLLSERIYSVTNNGTKMGLFLGYVYEDKISDPSRMRVKNVQYMGVYGLGANDLTLDNSEYVDPNYPTVYDIAVVLGGKDQINKIKFRRGLRADSPYLNNPELIVDSEYTTNSFDITADFQLLKFNITSIEKQNTDAIVETSFKHGLTTGQKVNISGANDTKYTGEKQITVLTPYKFKYTVEDTALSEVTGDLYFDEGIKIKFTTPYNHDLSDRYLMSTVDFVENETIIGSKSGASATVSSGAVYSPNLFPGLNARIAGIAAENDTGSIGGVEITNPGIGFSTLPAITANNIGDGNARFTARIGALATFDGKYEDENGFLSYSKKIFDGNYFQDFSYVLKNRIQFNDYEQTIKKLIHPVGTKMFGQYVVDTDDLNFTFENFISFEDQSPIYLENVSNQRILAEEYFEPNHNVDHYVRKDIQNYGSGELFKIQGGNNIIVVSNSIEKVDIDFEANNSIIIDDEQKFTVSFGELLLENHLKGKISTDSQNTITQFVLENPVTYKIENLFALEDFDNLLLEDSNYLGLENYKYSEGRITTFDLRDKIYHKLNDEETISMILMDNELDSSGNRKILVHSTGSDRFDLNSNLFTRSQTTQYKYGSTSKIINYTSNLVFGHSYNYQISKISSSSYGLQNIILTTATDHLLSVNDIIVIENSKSYQGFRYYDGEHVVRKVFDNRSFEIQLRFFIDEGIIPDFTNARLYYRAGTDFQNDLNIGDVITFHNNDYETEISSIINSSCISVKTRIDSDINETFNLITENYYQNLPLILEDDENVSVNLVLDNRQFDQTSFSKKETEYSLVLEQSIRGYTDANGLNTGINSIVLKNSRIQHDLDVNDIISLSSKPNKKTKILEIIDFDLILLETGESLFLEGKDDTYRLINENNIDNQQIIVDVPLGNGDTKQSLNLFSTRNLDLEEKNNLIYLNSPYNSSNNGVYIKSSNTKILDEGQLLLEDGIGTGSPEYDGYSSNEGRILYESNTTFYDVNIKIDVLT